MNILRQYKSCLQFYCNPQISKIKKKKNRNTHLEMIKSFKFYLTFISSIFLIIFGLINPHGHTRLIKLECVLETYCDFQFFGLITGLREKNYNTKIKNNELT